MKTHVTKEHVAFRLLFLESLLFLEPWSMPVWIDSVLTPLRRYKKKQSKATSMSTSDRDAHDQLAQSLEVRI
jgi:hypothetical protein